MKQIKHNGYYLSFELYMHGVELRFRSPSGDYMAIKESTLLSLLYKSGLYHQIQDGGWDEWILKECSEGNV